MSEANERQVGGDHYSKAGKDEQHWDRVARLKLDYFQAQITKYVERCWDKNGIEDLKKAQHFIEKYIELCEKAGRLHGTQSLKREQLVKFLREANERLREENAELQDAAGRAPLQLDWLLQNVVVREDGQVTTPDGISHHCLQGHGLNIGLDFIFEGAFGDGRVMWTCIKCKNKVHTRGAQLPHALHRTCNIPYDGIANRAQYEAEAAHAAQAEPDDGSEPQAHGYVDQDNELTPGPHTIMYPGQPTHRI